MLVNKCSFQYEKQLAPVPLSQAFCKESARGTICSIKKCNDDPTTYFFSIGMSQVFEQVNFSLSRDMGISESTFSGPIAITAAPIHSWSCREAKPCTRINGNKIIQWIQLLRPLKYSCITNRENITNNSFQHRNFAAICNPHAVLYLYTYRWNKHNLSIGPSCSVFYFF